MEDGSNYIQHIEFSGDTEYEFPIYKPLMDDGWLCCLAQGSIVVELNYKKYTLTASENEMVYFLVNEGMFFSILSASSNLQLNIMSISHTCLTWAYPYLGSEANVHVSYPILLTSTQVETPLKDMLISTYNQMKLVFENSGDLLEYEKMLTGLIVYMLIVYSNVVSKWRETQGVHLKDRLGIESQTQSYQIMNNLAMIFDEPESMQHREVQYYADRLHISVRYFYNVCKQETGMTPKDFINDIIISEIKHTLLTTNLSIQQLTLKYAFVDQSAFTQYFRRNTGMTPTEFRSQHK